MDEYCIDKDYTERSYNRSRYENVERSWDE